jgi:hypothetical protein
LDTLWSAYQICLWGAFLLLFWYRYQSRLSIEISIGCFIAILLFTVIGAVLRVQHCCEYWETTQLDLHINVKRSMTYALNINILLILIGLSVLNSGLAFLFAWTHGLLLVVVQSHCLQNHHTVVRCLNSFVSPLSVFLTLNFFMSGDRLSIRFSTLISRWIEELLYRNSWFLYIIFLTYLPNWAISLNTGYHHETCE